MKIAIISFGHVDVILPLIKYLKKSNIDVYLYLCFSLNRKYESILNFIDKNLYTGFTDLKKTEELLVPEIKNYLGDISQVKFFIFYNLKLRSLRNFFLARKLAKELKKYDIIHFNGTNGVLPYLWFFLRRKKLVFSVHDIKSHTGEKTRLNFAEKLNRTILKSRHTIIIQNKKDYKTLIDSNKIIDKNKIIYIPFGILEPYRIFDKSDQNLIHSDILFFGRISPYKGIEYLITAIEKLKNQGLAVKTIVAGKGEIYFNVNKLEKLDILLINRYIPNSELVSLIKGTKVIVCPYIDATQSGVIMTAYAFNKPVIASDTGGISDVVQDGITGLLVRPKNADDLAEKIFELINNSNLYQQMKTNIANLYESWEYSWEKITQKMIEIYNSIYSVKVK